jgi:hypothetical protein
MENEARKTRRWRLKNETAPFVAGGFLLLTIAQSEHTWLES